MSKELRANKSVSRATMLRTVTAAAVGAVAAGAMNAGDASALNAPCILATRETHPIPTTPSRPPRCITGGTHTVGAILLAQDGNNYMPSDSSYTCALAGWASAHVIAGVYGYSQNPKGIGVIGFCANKGGMFGGDNANINLEPTNALHPHTGSAGDLFVDKNKNLWFCKGGTHWVKPA